MKAGRAGFPSAEPLRGHARWSMSASAGEDGYGKQAWLKTERSGRCNQQRSSRPPDNRERAEAPRYPCPFCMQSGYCSLYFQMAISMRLVYHDGPAPRDRSRCPGADRVSAAGGFRSRADTRGETGRQKQRAGNASEMRWKRPRPEDIRGRPLRAANPRFRTGNCRILSGF